MLNEFAFVLQQQCRVKPGGSLLIGVSGGADSVALLLLLRELSGAMQLDLHVAHLDHALREGSAADAVWVAELSRKLGVTCVCERIDAAELARQRGQGVEEAARFARHQFLHRQADRYSTAAIALGHHQGDQAETVLLRLLRGSGTTGMSGMAYRRGRLIRPLLGLRREQLESYLREVGQAWLTDPSNHNLDLTRNRVRHQLLPQLASFNPQIEASLCRMAQRFARDEDCLAELTTVAFERLVQSSGGFFFLSIKALLGVHPALRMRLYRQLLHEARSSLQGISALHLEAIDALVTAERSQASLDLPGAWVARRYDELLVGCEPLPLAEPFRCKIDGPGTYPLPGGGTLWICFAEATSVESQHLVEFSSDKIDFPFVLRSIRPGDRFRPSGMTGTKKLKDYFIDAKLTLEERSTALVLESEEILWLLGRRRCSGYAANGAERVIRMVLQPA